MDQTRRAHRPGLRAAAFTLLVGAAALGCDGTRLMSGGPFTAAVSTPEGTVRYSLSKSVVTVEATVTRGASGKVTFDGNEFSVDTKLVRKDAKAAVAIQSVADEDQFFTLRLEHGGSADDTLSVELAPNGQLRSIGVTSTSQIGTTIKNVVTVVASVAAAVAAAALSSDPRRQAAALVCEKLAAEAGTPGRCPVAVPPAPPAQPPRKVDTKSGVPFTPPPAPSPTASTTAASACDKRTEVSLTELSMANLYFLARGAKNRRLWLDRRDADTRLQERTCRRLDLERQAERATGSDLDQVRSRLATLIQLETAARTDLRTTTEELDTAVRGFQIETGIDGPARTEVVRMTFDLDEIPSPEILRGAITPDPTTRVTGMADTQVREALRPFPRMLELYDRTGIAMTLTPPPFIARGGTVWEPGEPGETRTHIYYRPAYTAVLTTYATSRTADAQGGEQELLRFSSVVSDDVIHRKMPVQGLAFEPAAFAERKISLAFDDKGRLTRFEQAGKSSVVGATASAVEAIRLVRDEYTSTLSRIAEIQDTQRRLDQNDAITEIDRLRKQRELLDARLELAGPRGSYDLLLERKRLDQELGAVQGARARADKQDMSALSQEVAELRARLDQLARQVEELKHRQETTPPATTFPTGR
jgi:hypothetical protein